MTISDDSFHPIESGIKYDSLLRVPNESELQEHDFPEISPALSRQLSNDTHCNTYNNMTLEIYNARTLDLSLKYGPRDVFTQGITLH